jgi:hypothetical protein
MGCDGVGITLPDADNTHLRIYALDSVFSDESVHEESFVPIDEDISGAVFRTGKLWCGSIQEARRLGMKYTLQAEVGTVCILPLVRRGRVLGIFGVVKYQDNAFSGDIEFLTQIANQVAIAVENALAYGKIRELKDQLSKEKLYLEDEIRTEMNFAQIIGNSGSLHRVLKNVETVAPTDSTVLIQIQQCTAADRRHSRHAHTAAGHRIKHPLRDLQEPTSWVLIDTAPTHSSPTPGQSFVDRHSASVPRVPRVTDFSQFNIMGVALSTRITRSATTRAKRI